MMTLGPPHSSGPAPAHELTRQRQLEHARRLGWPQLDPDDLLDRRFGIVEHKPTGRFYSVHRGELVDAVYTSATAWYQDGDDIVFLEDPAGFPASVDELEQRRAAKAAARLRPRVRR